MNELKILDNKTIGVLGLGYIGRNLIEYIKQNVENPRIVEINRANLSIVEHENFDYFFNCAGNTGDFRAQIIETLESNINLNVYLSRFLKINESLVYLSSTRIYGFTDDPNQHFNEKFYAREAHLDLNHIYNGAKRLAESYLWNISNQMTYKTLICRLSNVYGAYKMEDLNDSTFVKILLKHHVEGERIEILQNMQNRKGYIHIEDAIRALLLTAIKSKKTDVFNVCSGESYSPLDWVTKLELDFTAHVDNQRPMFSAIDIHKIQKEIGFNPEHHLKDISLKKIIVDTND